MENLNLEPLWKNLDNFQLASYDLKDIIKSLEAKSINKSFVNDLQTIDKELAKHIDFFLYLISEFESKNDT